MLPLARTTPSCVKPLQFHRRFLSLTAAGDPPPSTPSLADPIDESHLLRVCTVLYQQQTASDAKLHAKLSKTLFGLTPEFFLQVCNKFPYSWRPIYRFHQFALSRPDFAHNSTSFNKMLDAVGKSRNIDLLWELCREIGRIRLANIKTYVIALRTLAVARELKKCIEFFHMMNAFGYGYRIEDLNKVVECLCRNKLVAEAKHVVVKLTDWIQPDCETYRWLMYGFCDVGDLIEASKVWNLMVDLGFEIGSDSVEIMLERLFKDGEFEKGMSLFRSIDNDFPAAAPTYKLVIKWLGKKGKLRDAYQVFDEMRMRGMKPDTETLGSLVYLLMSKGRVNEGYKVFDSVENPDTFVYHGMIKGLLRLKNPGEATQVFRKMVKRGCEPTMHTYVMLLQGHLGRRGRRGEDPLVNFDTIFVGGLVKAGKVLEANKYAERVIDRRVEVPRFDYSKFLHCFSNEEGVAMFEAMAGKLREVGLFDLADIFERYGLKMATRDRRRDQATTQLEDITTMPRSN